jgi:hypothetical protein
MGTVMEESQTRPNNFWRSLWVAVPGALTFIVALVAVTT